MGKKLIEVALPLDAINEASAREKSIRHGHPSTLHLWWARRPLATARAVLFASLVDDPSAHPEEFPTEETQDAERQRLFRLIERLVLWENINDQELYEEAYAEIKKSTNGNPPPVFDPFAGGGAIPLEAQRLGLKPLAADLNPVAVMINKAMIEIPPRFKDMPPVNPEARRKIDSRGEYHGAQGLAEDVRYYGELLKEKAFAKVGHLYPQVTIPETGQQATVIAWIWARTEKCPNPACGCEMPLVHSFWLSKKKGKEAYVMPVVSGNQVHYEVRYGKNNVPEGTVNRSGARCICCGANVPFDYIREESRTGRMGARLIAVVAESDGGRNYVSPILEHEKIADIDEPLDCINADLPSKALGFRIQAYGMLKWKQLFTNRQLTTLSTLSELLPEVQQEVYQDAVMDSRDEKTLADGGSGRKAYSEAVCVYLAFLIDKLTDYNSSICSWHNSGEKLRNTFGRQAIPMVWDFAEANFFSNSSGCFDNMLEWVEKALLNMPSKVAGKVKQKNAAEDNGLRGVMVSSDPPYYDNIGYADLSDFFYIWLRKSLKGIYPDIFSTMLVPKQTELVATPYRFDGSKTKAKSFFEQGMLTTCQQIYKYAREDIPVTIYYAFKQSDTDEQGTASSGWETMLSAIIQSGFTITGTWPARTEMGARNRAHASNALASSIVLVCRKRQAEAPVCTRKQFLRSLRTELQTSLEKLQQSNIAPVDLAQSAIGPGISVYSRYNKVLEADGSPMTVRSALQLINQELDDYFSGQGEKLDAESRFCVELYTQCAFNELSFGEADVLARAKNISVEKMAESGVVISAKGKVRLADRDELPAFAVNQAVSHWLRMQQLVKLLEEQGVEGCAKALKDAVGDLDYIKNLAYRLYQIADQKKWAQEGTVYNNLVISWADIMNAIAELRNAGVETFTLELAADTERVVK